MAEIMINTAFRNVNYHRDSLRRSEHVLDRMMERGISKEHIREAVQKGPKTIRTDGSIIAEFRWFKVVYRVIIFGKTRKTNPITVMEA